MKEEEERVKVEEERVEDEEQPNEEEEEKEKGNEGRLSTVLRMQQGDAILDECRQFLLGAKEIRQSE